MAKQLHTSVRCTLLLLVLLPYQREPPPPPPPPLPLPVNRLATGWVVGLRKLLSRMKTRVKLYTMRLLHAGSGFCGFPRMETYTPGQSKMLTFCTSFVWEKIALQYWVQFVIDFAEDLCFSVLISSAIAMWNNTEFLDCMWCDERFVRCQTILNQIFNEFCCDCPTSLHRLPYPSYRQ